MHDSSTTRHQDGLRIIAAGAVVVLHYSDYFKDDAIGRFMVAHTWHFNLFVDLFFVVSGFVIARQYFGRVNDAASIGRFLWRRLARIYPLHLATLAFYLALAGALHFGAGKRQVEGKRRQMQRIYPGDAAPEKSARRGRLADLIEILTGDDEAGDDEEQIHELVEMPGVGDHETPGGLVPDIIRVVKDDHGAGRDDPQSVRCLVVLVIMQGCVYPGLELFGRGGCQAARPAIRLMTASRSPCAMAFQRARFCAASAT